MVYRPPFIKQLDGTAFAGLNCTLASACMAAIRHMRGINPRGTAMWYPKPWYLRHHTGDRSGGTNLAQVDRVLNDLYSINLEVAYGESWDFFRSQIRAGRGAILQGGYSAIRHTRWSGSETFGGNHAVYINEIRRNYRLDRWEYLMYDPLADGRRKGIDKGPSWIPEDVLKKFAGRLEIIPGVFSGFGRVWAAFTRDTEPPVQLDEGAKKYPYGPRVFYAAKDHARVRADASPKARQVVTLDKGDTFLVYQMKRGVEVAGSDLWYGNRTGTLWMRAGVLDKTR